MRFLDLRTGKIHEREDPRDPEPITEHHIGCYVVEGTPSLTTALAAIRAAKRKGKHSGQPFQCRSQRVRVWLRGHYLARSSK